MQNLDETSPSGLDDREDLEPLAETRETIPDQQFQDPEEPSKPPQKKKRWFGKIFSGAIFFIGMIIIAIFAGISMAEKDRVDYMNSVMEPTIQAQFILGLLDMENGNYDLARYRFEEILKRDPSHAGAKEELTKAIIAMSNSGTAIPTPMPGATLTPTKDTRNQEELFAQAQVFLAGQDWDNLLITLDLLRKADAKFEALEIDRMYYLAYRNRGVHRISVQGNLEGGIFDINRAEQFGPIDIEAANWRQWAEWYLTGASFWELDWEKVVEYFKLVAPVAPNLSDSSYFTAQSRLATAQAYVAEDYIFQARMRYSQGRYCDAYDFYTWAMPYVELSPEDTTKYNTARNICLGITPEAPAPPAATDTPTP